MKDDPLVPLILGRPIIGIAAILLDSKRNTVILNVGDEVAILEPDIDGVFTRTKALGMMKFMS